MRARHGSLLWLALILVIGVSLAVLASLPLLRGDADGTQGSLVGQPAPAIEAADLDGRAWTLDDGTGRVTWINFWATSCEPCRTEMPAMQALSEAYGDRLLILGVDWGESQESVTDFTDRYRIDYPILLDPRLENYYRWASTDGLPRHFFVDADGMVVREVIGPLDPSRMATILAELIGPV
jgi:cytochrome c biogenesis protein CcmG, thiol:disulfide interchange protein DsbE